LFSALDEKEVESVLVHVKRHDNLLRLFQAGVVALFWFHPLVWWLDRRLSWESESACDEAVLRVTGASRVYATGLFRAVRYALELNLPGVSRMLRTGLQSRLRAVLNHQGRNSAPSWCGEIARNRRLETAVFLWANARVVRPPFHSLSRGRRDWHALG
jgi:beta-lactamase regulating signal transducer with metallopeptidase domain